MFVFNSINWTPKGGRIKDIIQQMNLREQNVLFIDDNPSNRAEAKSFCHEIMVSDVDIIPSLIKYYVETSGKDSAHKRLKQYQLLEKKKSYQAQAGSNIEFLRQSNIKVEVHKDCIQNIERIHELIMRSNQLNFTKNRCSLNELTELIHDNTCDCAYITVTDNFGDYGIVGFYAIKNSNAIHFTFSCRTLGMGVEQYIYQLLGKPNLKIVGEVSSRLDDVVVDWINTNTKSTVGDKMSTNHQKIILKGPCDLEQLFAYIKKDDNIITEFVYINDKGIRISQGTHTKHIIQSLTISAEDKVRLSKELKFGDIGMYETKIFDPNVDIVVLSLLADPSFGLYREKRTGIIVAFGEYVNDFTNREMWPKYINGDVFLSNCTFSEEDLELFANNFEFLGRIQPEEIICDLDRIYQNLNESTKLILILGSELEYKNNTQPAYEDRHKYHKILNSYVRDWQKNKSKAQIIDINNYLTGQENFTNNINHYTRDIYYKLSKDLISVIASFNGIKIKSQSRLSLKCSEYRKRITGFFAKIKQIIFKKSH